MLGDRDVVLFDGGREGYGDSRDRGFSTYHWGVGSDCRSGRWVPAAAYTRVLASNNFSKIACLFEWDNASSQPILIWTGGDGAGNATIYVWSNGAVVETDFAQLAFTDGVLFRHDQDATADADEAMAWFCNGFSNQVLVRRKRDGTTDTGATTTHTAKADLLAPVSADFYRVVADYKVGKLTLNTDPGLTGNWPSQSASSGAGRPTWPINKVVPLGGSPVVLSGLGIFRYNSAPSTAVFDSWLTTTPHPDNGKGGTIDGRGRIYYPTFDGHMIVVTFGSQQSQTPTKATAYDRSTPYGRISAMTTDLDHPYIAIEPGFIRTQDGVGLVVKKQVGATVTTDTTNLTDRKYNTTAAWNTLVSGNYIWVGADEPFTGIYVELDTARASTTAATALTASYGTTAPSTYTALTVMDSTKCFVESGAIVFHVNRIHPFNAATPWVKTTVDGVEKYWIRLEVLSTLTGVTPREVYIIPYRPPIDPDRNAITGYKQSGALPTILVSTWEGERLIHQDWQTLWTSKIEQMVVSRVNDGVTDSARALYAVTSDGLYAIPVGVDGDPGRGAYPNLGDADTFAAGVGDHVLVASGNNLGLPANPKRIFVLVFDGENLQSDDALYVYLRFDQADRWERYGPYSHFPVPVEVNPELTGRIVEVGWAFDDGSRTAMAPHVTSVTVPAGHWEWEERNLATTPGVDAASPQTV